MGAADPGRVVDTFHELGGRLLLQAAKTIEPAPTQLVHDESQDQVGGEVSDLLHVSVRSPYGNTCLTNVVELQRLLHKLVMRFVSASKGVVVRVLVRVVVVWRVLAAAVMLFVVCLALLASSQHVQSVEDVVVVHCPACRASEENRIDNEERKEKEREGNRGFMSRHGAFAWARQLRWTAPSQCHPLQPHVLDAPESFQAK